jgi:hypothetical protein
VARLVEIVVAIFEKKEEDGHTLMASDLTHYPLAAANKIGTGFASWFRFKHSFVFSNGCLNRKNLKPEFTRLGCPRQQLFLIKRF